MKIPKSLKLPRKLKKEVKKGITRNVRNTPDGVSCSMYETVSYSGSNTKAFRRLLKYLFRLQKLYDRYQPVNPVTIVNPENILWFSFKIACYLKNMHYICNRITHVVYSITKFVICFQQIVLMAKQ